MFDTILKELFTFGGVASDVGIVDWLRLSATSGLLAALVHVGADKLARLGRPGFAS